jgi:hypothetical protein
VTRRDLRLRPPHRPGSPRADVPTYSAHAPEPRKPRHLITEPTLIEAGRRPLLRLVLPKRRLPPGAPFADSLQRHAVTANRKTSWKPLTFAATDYAPGLLVDPRPGRADRPDRQLTEQSSPAGRRLRPAHRQEPATPYWTATNPAASSSRSSRASANPPDRNRHALISSNSDRRRGRSGPPPPSAQAVHHTLAAQQAIRTHATALNHLDPPPPVGRSQRPPRPKPQQKTAGTDRRAPLRDAVGSQPTPPKTAPRPSGVFDWTTAD